MAFISTEEQARERAYHEKSALVGYVLWAFLGGTGAHRFYFGHVNGALGQLTLLLGGFAGLVAYHGFGYDFSYAMLAWGGLTFLQFWLLYDAFCIPEWCRRHSQSLNSRFGIVY